VKQIDKILNRITMYRLVVYVLGIYAVLSIVFAFAGKLSFSPTALVGSLALVLVPAYAIDRLLGRLFRVPTNMESALITSLIIFLIVQPANSVMTAVALVVAGTVSSASKFLLAWNGKHIFNPAAFAAAVLSLTGLQAATWWIGSTIFWPVTALLGLAVVWKIRRLPLAFAFGFVAVGLQGFLYYHSHVDLGEAMKHALFASPIIFLGSIMLTEPATMPPRRNLQIVFGMLVAVLYIEAWHVGPLYVYPEVALLLGNVFAYMVSPKFRVRLRLQEVRQVSERVYDYVFKPDRPFNFMPGQYMEWTLAGVPYDSRGNRRTFTIASSPTEEYVHLGLKFYEPASQYKAALERLRPGEVVYASQLAGNFTLKGKEKEKLVFIAGGIGITPFRSMIKYLTDQNMRVDAVLLYVVGDPSEFAYKQEIQEAARIGLRAVPIVTDLNYKREGVVTGRLNPDRLRQLVPDYAERTFYISGPNAMVDAAKGHLYALHVPVQHIITDHFAGY